MPGIGMRIGLNQHPTANTLVRNGNFANGLADWDTPLGNWTVANGQATTTNALDYFPLGQSRLIPGVAYVLTFDLVSITAGTLSFRTNGSSNVQGQWTTSGSKSLNFTADAIDFSFSRSASPLTCTIDNVAIVRA